MSAQEGSNWSFEELADCWLESAAIYRKLEAGAWFRWTRKRYRKDVERCKSEARACLEDAARWSFLEAYS